jgi:hypothetical protein
MKIALEPVFVIMVYFKQQDDQIYKQVEFLLLQYSVLASLFILVQVFLIQEVFQQLLEQPLLI